LLKKDVSRRSEVITTRNPQRVQLRSHYGFDSYETKRHSRSSNITDGVPVCALVYHVFPGPGEEEKMIKGSERVVRKAYGAGRWFPGDGKELKSMVDGYIEDARVDKGKGRIVGAIAPHAGYVYSGKVAGYTFRAIKDNVANWGRPEVVVVLGLSHRGGFQGVALMDGEPLRPHLERHSSTKRPQRYWRPRAPGYILITGPMRVNTRLKTRSLSYREHYLKQS